MPNWITPSSDSRHHSPAADQYTLRLRLPGMTKENIMVAFLDGCVEIHGLARVEREEEAPGIHYYEAEELAAHHRIPLPQDAEPGRAKVTVIDEEALIVIPRRSSNP